VKIKDLGEINLIKRLSKGFRLDRSVIKGAGDDAAVIRWTKDKYLLFTCDMAIEDVHFNLKESAPFQIGWKALGRNISDIAAMGGVPRYAVVSLGISPELNISVADGICKGIKNLADRFGVSIVGGDMSRAKKIVIDISLIGEVEKNKLTLRSGAKKGDVILVTGALGGSIKGKHLNFMPRISEARKILKGFKINSMIDISDGLALDLYRILKASSVGAYIYEGAIPISKDARSLKNALYDGEDYELLFTMGAKEAGRFFNTSTSLSINPEHGRRVNTAYQKMKTPFTLIGEIVDKKKGYKIIRQDGRKEKIKAIGYLHF